MLVQSDQLFMKNASHDGKQAQAKTMQFDFLTVFQNNIRYFDFALFSLSS
jgi:hypothetical protein